MISTFNRYYQTLKYLQPIQWYGQLKYRFYKTRIKNFSSLAMRETKCDFVQPIAKLVALDNQGNLTLLNQTANIHDPSLWDNNTSNKLWSYHLQYFDYLPLLPDATSFINAWIAHNNIGTVNAWESYPISLRIVNWIKHWSSNAVTTNILESLCLQVRYLNTRLEIHLLGNHFLANAKALMYAGCFFSGKEADKWYIKGLHIFQQQLRIQILSDGGHCELSPMYHSIIIEDLLDVINLHQVYGKSIPEEWLQTLKQMFDWLATMLHPDQQIAFFNDSTFNQAPSFDALVKYADRLNLFVTPKVLSSLPASGYYRLENSKAVLMADAANVGPDYQPGHAHADTLSFEFSLLGTRCFVNSGTSTYDDNSERRWQRSTKAHNTITINGRNSSNVWKSFRVAERAHPSRIKFTGNKLSAAHDGYYRQFKIVHHRCWQLEANKLFIIDTLEGNTQCSIYLPIYLHPDIEVIAEDDQVYLSHPNMGSAKVCLDEPFSIQNSWYFSEFNKKVANKVILIERTVSLPFTNTVTVLLE